MQGPLVAQRQQDLLQDREGEQETQRVRQILELMGRTDASDTAGDSREVASDAVLRGAHSGPCGLSFRQGRSIGDHETGPATPGFGCDP